MQSAWALLTTSRLGNAHGGCWICVCCLAGEQEGQFNPQGPALGSLGTEGFTFHWERPCCCCCCLIIHSCPTLCSSWTIACQAPLSMGFPRQEFWSGLPFPSPGDLPNLGIKLKSPAWQADSLPLSHLGSWRKTCSVTKLCLTLCDPVDCSMPGFSVLPHLPEFAQTHVHWVSDAIQPSHPLLSPSLPALNLSQHQGLFQWVGSLHQVAKVLELQFQHQSFQWVFRVDFF